MLKYPQLACSWISTALVATLWSVQALAGVPGQIKINVALSPAGSFVAQSTQVDVRGTAVRSGSKVTASNIVLKIDSLKTGISLRDTHMTKKYFESDKYPEATLTRATGSNGSFTGELMVHGVKKPIEGTYEFAGPNCKVAFKTHLSDFKIAPAKYMGVGVDDEVQVEVTLPAAGKAH